MQIKATMENYLKTAQKQLFKGGEINLLQNSTPSPTLMKFVVGELNTHHKQRN